MSELDVSETEAVILAQAVAAVAAHHCDGDGCAWCTVAGATAEVLAEVDP